jgi:hypothetical protein
MASHFVAALKIPAVRSAHGRAHGGGDEHDSNEHLDIDTSMEVEASETDTEAIREASVTDFDAGDVVGKVLAFVAQIRACGEDTRDYLKHLSFSHSCPALEIKLWVRSRWGSLSDCFSVILAQRKVCSSDYLLRMITWFDRLLMLFVFSLTTIQTYRHCRKAKAGPTTS